jgi:hypothetical protein
MADKKLNDLTAATDAAYVYAEDASGNQVKISKASLASVVGELIETVTNSKNGLALAGMNSNIGIDMTQSGGINFNTYTGRVPVLAFGENSPSGGGYSYFLMWQMIYRNSILQIATNYDNNSAIYIRIKKGADGTWGSWKTL